MNILKRSLLVLFLAALKIYGQGYQPVWESLDKRLIPAWFEDSKFGIFIHWGVYSVPAWGPTGDSIGVYDKYAEWYWNKLVNTGSKVNKYFREFHLKTYGPNFKYQDFAPMFKAEFFNPDQWADLLKNQEQNMLCLPQNIMKDLPLAKLPRAGTGTVWILVRTVIFAATLLLL